jgi:hypothetical protein
MPRRKWKALRDWIIQVTENGVGWDFFDWIIQVKTQDDERQCDIVTSSCQESCDTIPSHGRVDLDYPRQVTPVLYDIDLDYPGHITGLLHDDVRRLTCDGLTRAH